MKTEDVVKFCRKKCKCSEYFNYGWNKIFNQHIMSQAEQDIYSSSSIAIWIIAHFLLDLCGKTEQRFQFYCIMTLFLVILKLTLYEYQSVITHDEYVFIWEQQPDFLIILYTWYVTIKHIRSRIKRIDLCLWLPIYFILFFLFEKKISFYRNKVSSKVICHHKNTISWCMEK